MTKRPLIETLIARRSAANDAMARHWDAIDTEHSMTKRHHHSKAANRMFAAWERYDEMVAWESWNVTQRNLKMGA